MCKYIRQIAPILLFAVFPFCHSTQAWEVWGANHPRRQCKLRENVSPPRRRRVLQGRPSHRRQCHKRQEKAFHIGLRAQQIHSLQDPPAYPLPTWQATSMRVGIWMSIRACPSFGRLAHQIFTLPASHAGNTMSSINALCSKDCARRHSQVNITWIVRLLNDTFFKA